MKFYQGEALRRYNTLALQAHAEAFVTVASEGELVAALNWARGKNLPVIPLGGGSNVVLAGDVNALVLRQNTRGIHVLEAGHHRVSLRVAAGENWHDFVRWTLQKGYYGLENLALIPGTVGAAPIQNIGAYGVEFEFALLQVHARTIADSQEVTLDRAACEFSYRESIFKREWRDRLVITAVDLQLSLRPNVKIAYPALADFFQGAKPGTVTPQSVFEAVVSIRRTKLPDPAKEPNAGSFFKNPLVPIAVAEDLLTRHPAIPVYAQPEGMVKLAAAWMIEHCGWKGLRENGLGVHPLHALVLVNYGSNNGEQLLQLASKIAETVNDTFGIRLVIEPRLYGVRS